MKEVLQGWSRRTSLSLAGDSNTRAEACPPGELFIRIEGGIFNFIHQIPVSASEPFQNSVGEQEHYLWAPQKLTGKHRSGSWQVKELSSSPLFLRSGEPDPPGEDAVGLLADTLADLGSIPGLGRSPGEGKDYPLQCSGLENSMDCIVHEVAHESHTWVGHDWATFTSLHFTSLHFSSSSSP